MINIYIYAKAVSIEQSWKYTVKKNLWSHMLQKRDRKTSSIAKTTLRPRNNYFALDKKIPSLMPDEIPEFLF